MNNKKGISFILAVMLVLGGSAWAETIKGTVSSVGPNLLRVTDKKGELCLVQVRSDTKLEGIKSLAELQNGASVKISGKDNNGFFEASSIKSGK